MDSTGTYTKGICGEKTMTLDAGHPSFLYVTVGTDPINDDLAIVFNTATAVITDCQVYTVSYTVAFADYASLATLTSTFTFELVDACIGATINTSAIGPLSAIWHTDSGSALNFAQTAFSDTVDTAATYPTGICGEKTVTLDAVTTPAFLSVVMDATDPVLNNFVVIYDYTAITPDEADIGVHTVTYTVEFKDDSRLATLTSTFTFEIQCPSAVVSSTLTQVIASYSVYDLAGPPLSLAAPVVVVYPVVCFTVGSFVITNDNAFGTTEFITSGLTTM